MLQIQYTTCAVGSILYMCVLVAYFPAALMHYRRYTNQYPDLMFADTVTPAGASEGAYLQVRGGEAGGSK